MSSELKEMNTAEEVAVNETAKEPEVEVENVSVPDLEEVSAEVDTTDTRDFELRMSDAERAKKKKRQEIWDKITTGLLIALMASPVFILAYIFIWFLTK